MNINNPSISYSSIDSITINGIYIVTETVGILQHENWDNNYALQLFQLNSTNEYRFRIKKGNIWSSWKSFSFSDHTHSEFQSIENQLSYAKKYFYSVNSSTSAIERNITVDEYTSIHCIVDATTLNIVFPTGRSMHGLVSVNRGASNSESGLLLVCVRNDRLFITVIKSMPLGCTYTTSNYTIGITTDSDVTGVVSLIC